MKNNLKPIEIGYGDDKVVFYPRAFSVAEEDDFAQKFNEIVDTDTEKYQKEFELCKTAIAEFSTELPIKLVKEKGEFKKLPLNDNETVLGAIDEFFKERTVENERIMRTVYQLFKNQQQPSYSFL